MSRKWLSAALGKAESAISRALSGLKEKGLIARVGSDRKGRWEVAGPAWPGLSQEVGSPETGEGGDATETVSETDNVPVSVPDNVPDNVPVNDTINEAIKGCPPDAPQSAVESAVLAALSADPCMSRKGLSESLGKAIKTISRALSGLKEKGLIARAGSDRKGRWEVAGPAGFRPSQEVVSPETGEGGDATETENETVNETVMRQKMSL